MSLVSVSWSGGVPSTGLVAAGISGLLPKPDVAIFADTGAETESTHATIAAWAPFVEANGVDVLQAPVATSIIEDIQSDNGHFADVPFYTRRPDGGVGKLKRQCTAEYKVRPIRRGLRDYLGLSRRGRLGSAIAEQWLGYTREEIGRIHAPRVAWIKERFPWIELGWYRFNVEEFLKCFCQVHSLPMPSASACWMCPFREDWWELPEHEREKAIDFDVSIRHIAKLKTDGPVYLHRSCVSLGRVVREGECEQPKTLQMSFALECGSGYCEL
jgi:hypothetical protein